MFSTLGSSKQQPDYNVVSSSACLIVIATAASLFIPRPTLTFISLVTVTVCGIASLCFVATAEKLSSRGKEVLVELGFAMACLISGSRLLLFLRDTAHYSRAPYWFSFAVASLLLYSVVIVVISALLRNRIQLNRKATALITGAQLIGTFALIISLVNGPAVSPIIENFYHRGWIVPGFFSLVFAGFFYVLPQLSYDLTTGFTKSLSTGLTLLLVAGFAMILPWAHSSAFVLNLVECLTLLSVTIPTLALYQTLGSEANALSRREESSAQTAAEAVNAERMMRLHQKVILALTKQQIQGQGDFDRTVRQIVEACADTLDVARVGVWLFSERRDELRCLNQWDRIRGRHFVEPTLRATEFPRYFKHIEAELIISAADARIDPRTNEFSRPYLVPKNIVSMMDVPIRAGGKTIGIICNETVGRKRHWSRDDENFALSLADLLAIAIETTERQRAQLEIKYRLQLEELIFDLTRQLIKAEPADADAIVQRALGEIGRFCSISRSYIFLFSDDGQHIINTHEWCARGISSQIENRQNVPVSALPWIIPQIKQGQPVFVDDIDKLPPAAAPDAALLRESDVKSFLWVPLAQKERVIGFAGFSSTHRDHQWSKESRAVLALFSDMFVSLAGRQRIELERKRFEQELHHTQKLESLGVLAGGIAHDFNNLLMGIIGNTGLALLELPVSHPIRKRLDQIKITAERAAELTNQLLAYSGKGTFIVEPINLGAITQEMANLLQTVISKRAELRFSIDDKIPAIDGDPTQIRQVIMNLITNASDALEGRTGLISVAICRRNVTPELLSRAFLNESLNVGEYVCLEVRDTGCGMDRETLDKIFDPFYTTKFTGRGLGLAAVLGIVRSHKAAIIVDSKKGIGTTFSILFPPSTAKLPELPLSDNHEEPYQGRGSVLVIDDEHTTRSVACEMLEHFGFQAISAESGRDGIDKFTKQCATISFVLLDLTMPDIDGVETAERLRMINTEIPIAIMSGYSEVEARNIFNGNHIAGFLQKPFTPQSLAKLAKSIQDSLIC